MNSRLSVKDNVLILITFFYVAYTIFPLFADITGIPAFIPAIFLVVVLYVMFPKSIIRKSSLFFYCYIGVLFLYVLVDKQFLINGLSPVLSQTYRVMIEAAWILPTITIVNVLHYKNNPRLYKIIGYGSLMLLVFSFLYILPLVISSANILRVSLGEELATRPLGLPDYDLMHAYTLILLPLCLCVKKTDTKRRVLYLFLLLLFGYMIIQTAVTTSLIIMSAVILFAIIFDIRKAPRSVLILILVLFIGYVFYQLGFFLMFVESLMPYFEDTAVAYKLDDIHTSLLQGQITGEALTGRMDYHQMSKDAFLDNPMIGSEISHLGHSKILDMLGSMGLLGFTPFLMMIISVMRSYIVRIKDRELNSYLYFSFFVSGIFLYTKGIFGAPGFLFTFLLVPSLILSVKYSNKETH